MTELEFQQNELVTRFGEEATLGDIFKQIENDLKAQNEVVCQFVVNGLSLDEQAEKRLAGARLQEVQTLTVKSEKPESILDNVLVSWAQQIPNMIELNDQLATQIRFKGIEGQLKALVQLIDESQLLVDSIMSIDMVFSQLPLVQSERWRQAQKLMAHGIGEALQAFQKKDFNWLADILEYDMGHSLQTWMELLESLKQDVENTAGRTP